jgi:sugar phosphate isomerase/epimerase
MGSTVKEFAARAARIPVHGVGLSVDVFSPDLLELHQALEAAGSPPDYLEIFKSPTRELARVRAALPEVPLAYHAEGLWLVDPAMRSATPWRQAVDTIARHADALGTGWATLECAGKQFGGYSFGTYLPPLFTRASAEAAAVNAAFAQARLDDWYAGRGRADASPLLLLELPPLTYFGIGDVPVSEFFARIAEPASCGLVLDIGHLWTHWRYRERRRYSSLEAYIAEFLATFPMDRVVQIHLAGLGMHDNDEPSNRLPCWIDRHDAPVPVVLFDLLRQVLGQPGLTALKGIALEVDTKEIPVIVEEFRRLREEVNGKVKFPPSPLPSHDPLLVTRCNLKSNWCPGQRVPRGEGLLKIPSPLRGEGEDESELGRLYETYARVVSGSETVETSGMASLAESLDTEGLHRYVTRYLPHELLSWGGDLAELFPAIWKALEQRGVTATDFVRFWFRQSRPVADPYDFFYLKLERWVEFVGEVAPDLREQAQSEAGILRALHAELNDEPVVLEGRA